MTAEKTTNIADAVRNLIVCDTQFGWNGETTLKLPELLDLQARGWLIEGDENNEFSLTTAGEAVVAQALRQAESIGSYPLAWLIVWRDLNATTGESAERTSLHRHNAVADYRAVDPDARVFPLYAALPAPRADLSPTATRKLEELAGQGYVTNGVAIFNSATGQRGLVDNLGYVGWQGAQGADLAPLRALVAAVEEEFCCEGTEANEPDDSKVSYPEETCPITFGMIRAARRAIDGRDAGTGVDRG